VNRIVACELPLNSLLRRYAKEGGYADCYRVDVAGVVAQAAFVEAFYTTWLFRIERALLHWFARRASTDEDARRFAAGAASSFAAWRVEGRDEVQLLLADFTGWTRSWLMAVPTESSVRGAVTRLYFGSAVVPRVDRSGWRSMGLGFVALLRFHRMYSRALLGAARTRLLRSPC
jgi:hypothetical protein